MFFNGVELAQNLSTGFLPEKELAVFQLISAYRNDGHLKAKLDPLQIKQNNNSKHTALSTFGLDEKDLSKTFQISSILGLKAGETLQNILDFMEKTYCGTISLQVGGCQPEIREWFFNEFERRRESFQLSADQKKNIFYELAKTEALEKFLHSRFVGAKRFSIEGGDALIPMLEYLAEKGVKQQVKELIIGMAHRGRLNVLNNFMNQATEIVFMEFDGGKAIQHFDFDGDVKYHMGYSSVKKFADDSSCNILLAYNPSHLEAVNPVVCGIARARQREWKDQKTRKAVLPVLIHGDAAFSGQGSVSETLQLSELEGFTTGGVFHIILNNQIGFTTDPIDARSSVHASDLAKAIQAPVLLVNADDVDTCIKAVDIALRFRQKFRKDIFIDLICYRRFGHNEGDEPAFTQPTIYQKIKSHPPVMNIYAEQMKKENLLSKKETQDFYNQQIQDLQNILDKTRKENQTLTKEDLKGKLWEQYKKTNEDDFFKEVDTCPLDKHLDTTLKTLTQAPSDFHLHPKVKKLILDREKKVKEDQLDWALCELAAYGTLCLENHPVRISGQDAKRGTFSHRHAIYFDTQTGAAYSPLSVLNPDKGEFCIYNSPLSEMAVLGFEYGNSCADHSFFTLWEAQFGDFANGAQIIIDQFISSGEEKWMQSCGLVLLLPHGYEGQGPEHSSARLERFLQFCAQGNMQVCYPTTPANFFHLLRRQVKRDFRKPLIVMTPKSLLRHPEVVSSKKELIRSSGFQEVIADPQVKKSKNIEVLILCSGKIYFDIKKERQLSSEDLSHTALVRMEQLYPFPKLALTPFLNGYHALKKVLWVQEEPANMGAASYIKPKIKSFMNELGLENTPLICISREEKASPATGSSQTHKTEYEELMKNLFIQVRR
jgi:2-oxoglutarate dehydrogenase E1 component